MISEGVSSVNLRSVSVKYTWNHFLYMSFKRDLLKSSSSTMCLQLAGGSESGKHDRAIGDSPVSGIFEYVGPSPDKLPMLLGRHSSHGYLADADKTAETDTPQDSNSAYKSGLLSTDSDLHSLPSKLSSQVNTASSAQRALWCTKTKEPVKAEPRVIFSL